MVENPRDSLILLFCRSLQNGICCHGFSDCICQSDLLACTFLPLHSSWCGLSSSSPHPGPLCCLLVVQAIDCGTPFRALLVLLYALSHSLLKLVFPITASHFLRTLLFQGLKQFLTMLAVSLCMPVPGGPPRSLHLRHSMPGPSSAQLGPWSLSPILLLPDQYNYYLFI